MASLRTWSDDEKADELLDWVQNDYDLYVEHGRLARFPSEGEVREFLTRAAMRYNAECLRGFPGADFGSAITIAIARMLEDAEEEE
jgi:hypothetical protein